jgi:hypothetical protein
MAMGIVSDKEFDSELGRLGPKSDSTKSEELKGEIVGEIKDVTRGRGQGNIGVPNGLRNIIGETSITDGRREAVELASIFGISPSSASAYAQGATSTSSYSDRPNGPVINKARERISKSARNKLMMALRHITEDKLEGTKARELAGIAKDMSAVVKNMEEDGPKVPTSNGPTFVFYSPQFRKEEHFEVIHAKE